MTTIDNNDNEINDKDFKINIDDSNYTSWEIFDSIDYSKCENIIVNPFASKLFSNDVFSFVNNNNVNIIHSSIYCIFIESLYRCV